MNFRFWLYRNDTFSKITVTSDRTEENPLRLFSRAKTEEGYHREIESFWVEDGLLYNATSSEGRDCDGRYETFALYFCRQSDLFAYEYDKQTYLPTWQKVTSSQRDYSAEAMNY